MREKPVGMATEAQEISWTEQAKDGLDGPAVGLDMNEMRVKVKFEDRNDGSAAQRTCLNGLHFKWLVAIGESASTL